MQSAWKQDSYFFEDQVTNRLGEELLLECQDGAKPCNGSLTKELKQLKNLTLCLYLLGENVVMSFVSLPSSYYRTGSHENLGP